MRVRLPASVFAVLLAASVLPPVAYSQPLSLEQYWAPATKEFPLRFAEGAPKRVVAHLEGRKAAYSKGAFASLNCWTGTLRSAPLEFRDKERGVPSPGRAYKRHPQRRAGS